MRAGDSWEDLHGTKDRPEKQTFRDNLAAGLSSGGICRAAHAAAKLKQQSAGAGPSSDNGAGPSAAGDADSGSDVEARAYWG